MVISARGEPGAVYVENDEEYDDLEEDGPWVEGREELLECFERPADMNGERLPVPGIRR
jgi:hypothetical protein